MQVPPTQRAASGAVIRIVYPAQGAICTRPVDDMASKDGERGGSDRSTYITQAATIFSGNQEQLGSMYQVLRDIDIGTFSRNQGQLGSMGRDFRTSSQKRFVYKDCRILMNWAFIKACPLSTRQNQNRIRKTLSIRCQTLSAGAASTRAMAPMRPAHAGRNAPTRHIAPILPNSR